MRETAKRVLSMRHFDVQLIGGIVLHEGKISEMKTGEGKTLVATLPAVLNALAGRGVHVVTVNDYLARRDAEWMSPLYKALGLSVGVIVHDLDDEQRRAAYGADAAADPDFMVYKISGAFFFGATAAVSAALDRIGRYPRAFVFDFADVPLID